jgi:hypothetical protein
LRTFGFVPVLLPEVTLDLQPIPSDRLQLFVRRKAGAPFHDTRVIGERFAARYGKKGLPVPLPKPSDVKAGRRNSLRPIRRDRRQDCSPTA